MSYRCWCGAEGSQHVHREPDATIVRRSSPPLPPTAPTSPEAAPTDFDTLAQLMDNREQAIAAKAYALGLEEGRAALATEKERAERLSGRCAALTDERDALRAVTGRMDGAAHDASERAKVAEEYLDRVRAILGADEDEPAEEVAQRVRRRADRAEAALVARHGGEPVAILAELDEARAALRLIRDFPIPEQDNMVAANMRAVATRVLERE